MNGPKYVILFLAMTLISYFILDGVFVTELRMTLPSELERATIHAMRASTHLGALRIHEVQISKARLLENLQAGMEPLHQNQAALTVHTVSETPPLVVAEAQATRTNILGRFIPDVKQTNVRAKTTIIGDLIKEGSHE